jgi:hypothetical protein
VSPSSDFQGDRTSASTIKCSEVMMGLGFSGWRSVVVQCGRSMNAGEEPPGEIIWAQAMDITVVSDVRHVVRKFL